MLRLIKWVIKRLITIFKRQALKEILLFILRMLLKLIEWLIELVKKLGR